MPAKPTVKVAFVYDDTLDGWEGVAQQVKILGGWLSARGHKVSYFVGQSKTKQWQGGKVYSLSRNAKVIFNGNRMSIPMPANKQVIRRSLAEQKPDILHVQMPHSPYMAQRVVDEASANTAIAGTFHVYPANKKVVFGSRLLKLLYFRGLRKFDAISAVSTAARGFADSAFGLASTVIPNTVDVGSLRSSAANEPETVVFLGRLVERKGCRQLIEAFRLVHNALPEAKLLIGGTGPKRAELEKLVQKLGLSDVVEFKGFIDEDKKGDFLAGGAVACFPSLYGESFGIVLIEAMAAGTGAVIGGHNPGYRSVLGANPYLLFDPNNKQELADKILELLRDNKKRASVSKWQAEAIGQYDVNTVGPQIEQLYARAIAKSLESRHN
ncbi:MAG: hypothetical protein JWO96_597 [Candidatus Saccharibacteria bacterium]|nr:hypothetical protein [Candidatus Saccharibacteria bacterium]